MECCDLDPIRIKEPTSRVVKTGYLTIYERGFFVNGWKDRYFKLYADSSLLWYHGNDDEYHKGGIRLKMVANFIAVGPMCLHTVCFPKLPKGRHVIHLMGVPDIFKKNTKRRNIKMNWILFPMDDGNMQAWLQAIKPTLPSPPARPEHPHLTESSNGDQISLYPIRYQPECQHINTRDETTYSGIQRGVILGGGALPYGIGAYGPGMGWRWGWGWGPNPYGGFWGSWNDFGDCGSVNIDRIVDDLCKQNNNYGYDIKDIREFERVNFSNTTNGGGDGCGGDECSCNDCLDNCCKCDISGDDCCGDNCCKDDCCCDCCFKDDFCGKDCCGKDCCGEDCCGDGGGVGGAGTVEYTGGDCGCGC
ncbi:uncharacterized protein [Mytilus edulis]|uniref:uncharacterized protein n=1 Tax=Mytilus edulis TaxID=6550 RepID=UPI0039EFB8BE